MSDVGTAGRLGWAAEQQSPSGVRDDHGLDGVLLVLPGDELLPVLSPGGRPSHPDLGAVDDPGLPIGAEMVDDFGERAQPEAGSYGAAPLGEQGPHFTDRTCDGGAVDTEPAGQHIVRGTVAEADQGGRQPVDEDQFVLRPRSDCPMAGP
jgi:hypothetical protein